MLIFIITFIGILFIMCLPSIFTSYTDMSYVQHLEDMGVYVDENGKEI